MFEHETSIRVRYGETDKMGYLYYGKYAQYYEVGRVEALRSLGITYKELENQHGIMMPVMTMQVRYLRPAHYDDLISIKTYIRKRPSKSIIFHSELFNEQEQFINKGEVRLAFIRIEDNQRIDMPEILEQKLAPYFE